ncbi:hypothetical protein ACHWQZ_G005650 [Mnemiopsis leidyi]
MTEVATKDTNSSNEFGGSPQKTLGHFRQAEDLYLSLIGPKSPLLKMQHNYEKNEDLRKQMVILEMRLFDVFQELEIHGKNVASAIRRVTGEGSDSNERQNGRKRTVIEVEADYAEKDCINELIWELKQIKHPIKTFEQAKKENENLEKALVALEHTEIGSEHLSDRVAKIILLMEEVFTKLKNSSDILEDSTKSGNRSLESRIIEHVRDIILKMTEIPSIRSQDYKRRCIEF